MKDLFVIFVMLLLVLTLISTFGGSIRVNAENKQKSLYENYSNIYPLEGLQDHFETTHDVVVEEEIVEEQLYPEVTDTIHEPSISQEDVSQNLCQVNYTPDTPIFQDIVMGVDEGSLYAPV